MLSMISFVPMGAGSGLVVSEAHQLHLHTKPQMRRYVYENE